MKIPTLRKVSGSLGLIILTSSLSSLFLEVHGLPQWVWNRDAIDSSRSGNSDQFFVGHSSNIPQSSRGFSSNSQKQQVTIVNGQSRLFLPSAISSVSNSLQNLGGGGNPGASAGSAISGIFGSVLQSIPQLATQAISGLFGNNQANTLPIKDPGDVNTGVSTPVTGACRCVSANACFLPSKPSGSCEGGKVKCCSTSRTVFPEDDDSSSSSSSGTKNDRTITQRELRRGLLKNILKGSGSVVDDTLDFLLQPFLTKEDQQKIATRIVDDQ